MTEEEMIVYQVVGMPVEDFNFTIEELEAWEREFEANATSEITIAPGITLKREVYPNSEL